MKWFQEQLYPGFSQRIAVTDCLLEKQTQIQKVQIFETPVFGKVLVLDNAIQITERDNHIYHEMLVHVPMFAHGDVKMFSSWEAGMAAACVKRSSIRLIQSRWSRSTARSSNCRGVSSPRYPVARSWTIARMS